MCKKFSLSRVTLCVFTLLVFTSYSVFSQVPQDITITTYYPSPYGAYNDITAHRMAIGNLNGDALDTVDVNDLPFDPAVPANPLVNSLVVGPDNAGNGGRIGIGTQAPTTELSIFNAGAGVISTGTANGTDDTGLGLSGGGDWGRGRGANIGLNGNEHATGGFLQIRAGYDAANTVGTNLEGSVLFRTGPGAGGTNRMIVHREGNVGINIAGNNPAHRLHVYEDTANINAIRAQSDNGVGIYVDNSAATSGAGIATHSSGTDGTDYGLYATSQNANAIQGETGYNLGSGVYGRGGKYGVRGFVNTADSYALYGISVGAGTSYGAYVSGPDYGIYATSGGTGVYGATSVSSNFGVYGNNSGASEANDGAAVRSHGRLWVSDGIISFKNNPVGLTNLTGQIITVAAIVAIIGAVMCAAIGWCFDITEPIHAKECEFTDVVVIDPDNDESVIKSHKSYDIGVAGIISSTEPILGRQLGEGGKKVKPLEKDDLPIALTGRVPCKVTTQNGPIKRGDLLVTSSKPGHAMRADIDKLKPGMLVGKALQPLEKDDGVILVFVRGW